LVCMLLAALVLNVHATWNGNKVGLAWDSNGTVSALLPSGGGVSWYYTWSAYPVAAATSAGLDFAPQLWGPTTVSAFQSQLAAGSFSTSTAVLGPNEPDNAGQANIDAATAVSLWNQYILPLKASHGLKLGAPAVSSASTGVTWLEEYFDALGGTGTTDFLPIHWYGSSASDFTNYVESVYTQFNLPIWVTEWACVQFVDTDPACDQASVNSFLSQTQTWLNQQSYVQRYSWFGAMATVPSGIPTTDLLLTSKGNSPTALGLQYVTNGAGGNQPTSPPLPSSTAPPASGYLQSTYNNLYVTLQSSSNQVLQATESSTSTAVLFKFASLTGGYSIQDSSTTQYASADNTGQSSLIANRATPSGWETFLFYEPSAGIWAIQATDNGQFVAVQTTNGNALLANSGYVPTSPSIALFKITSASSPSTPAPTPAPTSAPSSSGSSSAPPTVSINAVAGAKVALYSFSANAYVTVDSSTSLLVANSATLSGAAIFNLASITGGLSIQNAASGEYASADNAGANPVVANRPSPSSWETFVFQALTGGEFYVIEASINGNLLGVQSNNELIANIPASGAYPGSVLFVIVNA